MDNNASLANLPLSAGVSPLLRSAGLESPGTFSTFLMELNTPVHAMESGVADDDDGDVAVDDNGSRPRGGNGHDDGNDNI